MVFDTVQNVEVRSKQAKENEIDRAWAWPGHIDAGYPSGKCFHCIRSLCSQTDLK